VLVGGGGTVELGGGERLVRVEAGGVATLAGVAVFDDAATEVVDELERFVLTEL